MEKFEDGCYGCLKGIALIAKVLAGRCPMHYTRVAAGKGVIPDGLSPKVLEEPPDYVMDAMISSVTNPLDGECQVSVQINSAHVKEGFYVTGLLLYAEDPDEGEVPFTYLCLENEPEWMRPASSIVGKLAHFDIISAVGDIDNVSASIDPDALVTLAAVKQLISEHGRDLETHQNIWQAIRSVQIGLAGVVDVTRLDVTIPTTGWTSSTEAGERYPFAVDIPHDKITNKQIPNLAILPLSQAAAAECGLCPTPQTVPGALRVYAKTAPAAPLQGSLTLFGLSSYTGSGTTIEGGIFTLPPATETQLGGVKVGEGLNVAADGTISVDAANDAEINELLTEAFALDNK